MFRISIVTRLGSEIQIKFNLPHASGELPEEAYSGVHMYINSYDLDHMHPATVQDREKREQLIQVCACPGIV